ncbi:hypothetical protein [Pseudoalteromonas sp.]|uniref:hypothetical protein n=1 Tax=Pseudoalteromonas sp. TaxID=53249 RepID=UPI00356A14BE
MKPNYENYSYRSLLEALNSIDKSAYPERVVEIESCIQNWLEKKEFSARYKDNRFTSLLLLITLSIAGILTYFYGNSDDVRRYAIPLFLVLSPFCYWNILHKFKTHKHVICQIDQAGAFLRNVNTDNFIYWQEVKRAGFVTIKRKTKIWFEKQNQQDVIIELNLFDLDSTEVFAFVNYKAEQYGFELFEIDGFGQQKTVIPARNSQKIET